MADQEQVPISISWRAQIPVAAITAMVAAVGHAISIYNGHVTSGEVVKRVDEMSHRLERLEIVAVRLDAYDPRLASIEADLRRANDRILDIERGRHVP